jgi:hypothetical protein
MLRHGENPAMKPTPLALALAIILLPAAARAQISGNVPRYLASNSEPAKLTATPATSAPPATPLPPSPPSAVTISKSGSTVPTATTTIRVVASPQGIPLQPDDAITTPVTADQIATTPGAYNDIPRFLQTLPGVTFDNDARNSYLVNGGNPLENLFVVDGVEVPNINHISSANSSGGFVSMIDTDTVSTINLHTMLYGSQYSGALSSVLEINTLLPDDQQDHNLHGDSSVAYAGAGTVLERALGDSGSVLLEARKSIVNYFTNDIGIDGVPKYESILSKAILPLGDRDTLTTLYLQGIDSLTITPNLYDVQDPGYVDTVYTGSHLTAAATWAHPTGDTAIQRLQFVFSHVHTTTVQTDAMTSNSPVDSNSLIDQPATLKYTYDADATHLGLHAGASSTLHTLNYQIQQTNGFPSPYLVTPTPVDASNINLSTAPLDTAAYTDLSYRRLNGFEVTTGARLQHFGLNNATTISPRASLRSPSIKSIYLYGGAARYAQLAPLPTVLGIASNQALLPIGVTQLEAGVAQHTDSGQRLSLSAFRKLYTDYPVSTQFPSLSQADIVDTFGQPFLYMPMTSAGTGVASGFQLEFASSLTHRFFIQTNLATQHVTHRALDGISRPANFDMPVMANLMGGIRVGNRQRITSRYSYHTGTPYTPYLVQQSQQQDRPIFDLTQINTQRGPFYARLDVRYEIELTLRGRPMEIHAGLNNALNRQNYYQYVMVPHCNFCGPYELTQQGLTEDGGLTYRF